MNYKTILYEKEDSIVIITLNRPHKMNAFNEEWFQEVAQALDVIDNDKEVRALLITGGEKVFSVGNDISSSEGFETALGEEKIAKLFHETFNRIANLPIPVIAAIAGEAMGGGLELALSCDIRLGANNSIYALPEARLGVFPIGGGTVRLPNIVGQTWAKYMIFTGEAIDAQKAYEIGLISKIVDAKNILIEGKKLAFNLSKLPPISLRLSKRSINNSMNVGMDAGLLFEQSIVPILSGVEDAREGFNAFLEKRKPVYKGY